MITSKRKSEALTKDEYSSLKKYTKSFRTVVECAEAIGISREVLDRLLVVGSGSPVTIEKVRSALSVKQ
jgi:DNA-binding phage protein